MSIAPFLRWAGGKSWFTRRYKALFENLKFNSYHEPFLGSGSIFFSLGTQKTAYLSDTNEELIETYLAIKDTPHLVISELAKVKNDKESYYEVRSAKYTTPVKRAARFIYLNQTSFNGLYRVNLKGQYNVPYGNRTKDFLDETLLLQASNALQNATLECCDFESTLNNIHEGDFVFLDPPYTVSHNDNGFIKYNQNIFSLEDQYRLANFITRLCHKGCNYILTNAAHPEIGKIFSDQGDPTEVYRVSLIGGKRAYRGLTSEYIFTNLEFEL